jgi:hypothetical protein
MSDKKSNDSFSGKNKSEVSDGLRHGSSECGRKMREWKEEKSEKSKK